MDLIIKTIKNFSLGIIAMVVLLLIMSSIKLLHENGMPLPQKCNYKSLYIEQAPSPAGSNSVLNIVDAGFRMSLEFDPNNMFKSLILANNNDPNVSFIISKSVINSLGYL